jgi:predicted DNA repair protein MutK
MAGASLLALLDDIASGLDDVALMSKLAARKTAGVLGDDLALNAQQVAGVHAARELPVVWAVAKGSLLNKAILVPAALLVSAVVPWLVTPLLMVGGAYLCYEGAEKVVHRLRHGPGAGGHGGHDAAAAAAAPDLDLLEQNLDLLEKTKIRGAIRTDFVLSAEIIVIALGLVAQEPFAERIAVLAVVAVLMTAGVYGLVAAIVKLDDVGLRLQAVAGRRATARAARGLGGVLVGAAPRLMRGLAVAGTAAMFLVGGGILVHGIPGSHDLVHAWAHGAGGAVAVGPVLARLVPLLVNATAGVAAGLLLVVVVTPLRALARRAASRRRPLPPPA